MSLLLWTWLGKAHEKRCRAHSQLLGYCYAYGSKDAGRSGMGHKLPQKTC